MNPALAKLRSQIQQCKEFIALCERIKHLERLQDGRLDSKKLQLEQQRLEIVTQIELVSGEIKRLKLTLSGYDRTVAAFEVDQLRGEIKSAQIRLGVLQSSLETCNQEISQVDQDKTNSLDELQSLYAKLEELIQLEGLDPNTVEERLTALTNEKDLLMNTLRADVSTRPSHNQENTQKRKTFQAPAGTAIRASEFYTGLLVDFAEAKTSVEIISPYVNAQRAREILGELSLLAARGLNVIVYTRPPGEQDPNDSADLQAIIGEAHKLLITIIQRSGLEYNVAIIDNVVCWEGNINILGVSPAKETMSRTAASSHVREIRHFLFSESV